MNVLEKTEFTENTIVEEVKKIMDLMLLKLKNSIEVALIFLN